ncbi:MAG: asparagine synthase (glutamine-hydrolyzing) [Gemmatimonadota bacterium]
MCGIAGIVDPRGVSADEVRRMADAIAHRGPDDATVHVEDGVGFGFRRLAIIDLVTGRQPIPNEDGSVQVMLNGEIYNYRELRPGLEERGHLFRTRSDTEVIVHLYEERGADLVHALRGMFAIAVWDSRRRRLLLARDHLGQKPLFWARQGERLLFASEIKAILAVAPGLAEVDPRALDEYLTLRVIADPRTMFAGIHKLPPAHLMSWENGEPSIRRWWDLRFEPKPALSEEDALERLDEVVRESVGAHLVSDVPLGSFLSGGIDSGIVAAVAQSLTGEPLKTFSGSVPYRGFDEAPAAAAVARHCGTRHFEYRIGGDIIGLLPTLVHHLDEPSDPLSACMYHLARETRREVKVALGGDGGDERFGGYDRYYALYYVARYARLPAALREKVLRRILDLAPDGYWYKSLSHRLRWVDDLARVEGGRRYARALSYFYFTPRLREGLYTDRFRALVDGFDSEGSIVAWYEDDARVKEDLDRMLLADSMVREPNHPVMILDRMTMAHGLEARSPFLDYRLAEFAATLSTSLKVRGRQRRYLQMRLAERYLPAEVLSRPKQGFNSGLPYMMARQFRDLFQHYLTGAHLVEAGYLRPNAIRDLLVSHLGGRSDHGNRLWLLLNAELWHRIRIEGIPVADLEAEITSLLGRDSAETTPGRPAGDPVPSSLAS